MFVVLKGEEKLSTSTIFLKWLTNCLFLIILLLIVFFMSEMTFRLLLFIKEITLHSNHYVPFSKFTAFKFAYSFNWPTIVLLVSSIIILLALLTNKSFKRFWINNEHLLKLVAFAVFFVNIMTRGIETNFSSLNHVHYIRNAQVMDYGSGMASSYYYGYLNIIGPNYGDHRKGIIERMEEYESTYKVKFRVKKLFIIIPASLYIPTDLSEHSATLIQTNISLTALTVDRGGIAKRKFQSSVYHLKNENWYVTAEGATPLQTYREALDASGDETLKNMKHEMVLKFCKTLETLISSNEITRNRFLIIYYNDMESDSKIDIGEVITERIKQFD